MESFVTTEYVGSRSDCIMFKFACMHRQCMLENVNELITKAMCNTEWKKGHEDHFNNFLLCNKKQNNKTFFIIMHNR